MRKRSKLFQTTLNFDHKYREQIDLFSMIVSFIFCVYMGYNLLFK